MIEGDPNISRAWKNPPRVGVQMIGYILLLAMLVSGCSRPDDEPLRIGMNLWPPGEFLYLARELGYFDEAGLPIRLVEFGSISDSRRAFEKGRLDGLAATLSEVLAARNPDGERLVIERLINISEGADFIIADKSIESIEALKGRRVAVEPGSVSLYLLLRALERAEIAPQDVQIVAKDPTSMTLSLQRGQVEAIVTYTPMDQTLREDERFHVLFSSKEIPGEIIDVYAFSASVQANRAKELELFHRVMDRAFEFYRENPERALEIMARRHHLSGPEFGLALHEGIRLITPEEQTYFLGKESPIHTMLVRIAPVMEMIAPIKKPAEGSEEWQLP